VYNVLNITDLAGGVDELIQAVMSEPKIKKAKALSTATLMSMAATIAEQRVTAKLSDMIRAEFNDAIETHTIINGDFDTIDPASRDDWSSALDDSIEAVLEPYSAILSANWLATATDGPMHDPDHVATVAKSFAREAWKHINYDKETNKIKSTNKILSAIGLVENHFAAYLAQRSTTQERDNTMSTAVVSWMDALKAIHDFGELIGGVSMIPDLVDELDTASDDDDILATGAIERIGGAPEHVAALRALRVHYDQAAPGTAVSEMVKLLETRAWEATPTPPAAAPAPEPEPADLTDASMAELMGLPLDEYRRLYVENPTPAAGAPAAPPPTATAPPAATVAPTADADKPKRGRKPKEPTAPPTTAETPTEALALFSDNAKVKDDEVAEALGISRATYNNMRNAKQAAHLDDVQRMTLVSMIDEKIAKLQQAKALIDG
jgi:hypothetical protein